MNKATHLVTVAYDVAYPATPQGWDGGYRTLKLQPPARRTDGWTCDSI